MRNIICCGVMNTSVEKRFSLKGGKMAAGSCSFDVVYLRLSYNYAGKALGAIPGTVGSSCVQLKPKTYTGMVS